MGYLYYTCIKGEFQYFSTYGLFLKFVLKMVFCESLYLIVLEIKLKLNKNPIILEKLAKAPLR